MTHRPEIRLQRFGGVWGAYVQWQYQRRKHGWGIAVGKHSRNPEKALQSALAEARKQGAKV